MGTDEMTFVFNDATISENIWKDMCGEGTTFTLGVVPRQDLTDDDWNEILEEGEESTNSEE